MRPVIPFRDPAPSRSAYRLQRLWLTPGIRYALRLGVPTCCFLLAFGLWAADPERRAAFVEDLAEMRHEIERRPEFLVVLMAVEGATDPVAKELREIIPLDFPLSSFDIDLEAVRLRAEGLDAVATAEVRIRPGGVLAITVTEREPVAVWRSADGLMLIDATGHRVSDVSTRTSRPDLPLLAGPGAGGAVSEAIELLKAAEPIAPRIRGLLRVGERRWDVVLDRDQRIMLPERDPLEAIARVIAIDQVRNLLDRDVTIVDMRNPDRPTFRMSPGAAELLRQSRLTGTD